MFFNHIQFVLSTSRHYAPQKWHSHPNRNCHCRPNASKFAFNLAQLEDLPPWMQRKPRKGVITIDIPLIMAIKVFGCLYKHVNVFLHDYVNVVWSLKGPQGPNLSILVIFFLKKFQSHYKGCKHPPS
jgi:hypothetical protein